MGSGSVFSSFMPPEATAVAQHVDYLYAFLLIVSTISSLLVIGGLIYFGIKFRRQSENDKTPYIAHNSTLEFLWSFIPFVIFMIAFVWGWIVYSQLRTMPTEGLEIAVQGQQWNWTFVYKNGRSVAGEFYVPVHQDVRLVMTSNDVLHSFYVPAFRYKQDLVPGRYTSLWFNADKEGDYQVFCAEYCGDKHSAMEAKIHVVSREKYEQWLGNDPYKGLSMVDVGKKTWSSRCIACHNIDGAKGGVGPSWKGIFGQPVELVDKPSTVVDENYIRTSIVNPSADVVKGYGSIVDGKPMSPMPTFAGQLDEQEIMGVIEFIKSLK